MRENSEKKKYLVYLNTGTDTESGWVKDSDEHHKWFKLSVPKALQLVKKSQV